MKKSKKLAITIISILLGLLVTFFPNHSQEVLSQLNNGKDLTELNYHVEITVLVWLFCGIINLITWTRKEKKVLVKKTDFNFFSSQKEINHEK